MNRDAEEPSEFKVDDRRHWMRDAEEAAEEVEPEAPRGAVAELRERAESAEAKLKEYISAFREREREQDELRARLSADVERRVEQSFGELVAELLETLDELDLALSHGESVAEARPIVEGVTMVRDRFLASLERRGVQRILPDGEEFDPHVAEAVRVDPVESPDRDGAVTETLRAGYRLGERVIRAARVAVGRHAGRD